MKPGTSRSMVITDLPAYRKKSEAQATDLGRGELAADDLDQRDEVRRVERVADHGALGAARTRSASRVMPKPEVEDEITTSAGVAASMSASSAPLDVEVLGRALLHEVGLGARPRPGRARRSARPRLAPSARPSSVSAGQAAATRWRSRCLGVRCRVPGHHAVAAGQEVGDPAATDDAGADAGDGADVLGLTGSLIRPRLQREDLARLVGGGDRRAHRLDDRARAARPAGRWSPSRPC